MIPKEGERPQEQIERKKPRILSAEEPGSSTMTIGQYAKVCSLGTALGGFARECEINGVGRRQTLEIWNVLWDQYSNRSVR